MPEPVQATVMPSFDPKDVEENKVVAALSYVWILFIIPLLTKRESKYAQEHAKQGMILFIAWVIGSFIFWIPLIGWALAIALLVLNVLAFVKCLNGEYWAVPFTAEVRQMLKL